MVPDMPKTRSGTIMRRVLRAISNDEDAGDISTLANPEVVDEIRRMKIQAVVLECCPEKKGHTE
jgi:acetyl-CoA synthetase